MGSEQETSLGRERAPVVVVPDGSGREWRALDLVPDPVWVLDDRLRIEYANSPAARLLGCAVTELLGSPVAELDPRLAGVPADGGVAALTRPGEPAIRVGDLRRGDGTRVSCELHVRHARTVGADRPCVVVVARDLSRRQAQDERLQRSEKSFRTAFDQAPVGMAVVRIDTSGRRKILRANTSLAQMLGVTAGALAGRDLGEFSTTDNAEHDRQIVADLATGARTVYARHKQYLRADGSLVWAEVRVSRVDLPGVDGAITLAHFVDVTERHETERRRARRSELNAAVAEITTSVLAGTPLPEVYQLVADATARVFGAENVTLGLPSADGLYRAVAAVGPASTRLLSGDVPVNQEFVRRIIGLGSVAVPEPDPDIPVEVRGLLGPGAAARFGRPGPHGGLITMARPRGGEPFDATEVAELTLLAHQVALTVELGRARVDQQRLAVLEDRQRIARDLHDTVIQDIIAVGMQLDAGTLRDPDAARRARDAALIDQLEEAVRRLRGSVFDLRRPAAGRCLADSIRVVCTEAARMLGHTPSVRIDGPVETVPPVVEDAVVAVLRESLSNVARHARAGSTRVDLAVERDRVRLVVEDDGRGLPGWADGEPPAGDGITNIRQRAVGLNGQASVRTRPEGGTRVTWTCAVRSG